MADTFSELGLRAELVDAVAALGYERASAIQRGAIPVIRRGGNVVLQASSGAGLVGAYGLGIVDRLAGSEPAGTEGPRALVIVPSPECAAIVAVSLARFARRVGLRTAGAGPGWPAEAQASSEIRIMTLPDALRSIRTSRLKLDGLEALVIDHAPAIVELHGWDGIESILVTIPREAQRVVTAGASSSELDDFVERHARRALYVPARAVEEPGRPETRPATATVGYVPVAAEARFAAAAAVLSADEGAAGARFHCRTAAEAGALADALSLRGFEAVATASVVTGGADADDALAVSLHAPVDAESLLARHEKGGLVLVEPRHLAHLLRIADEAGIALVPRTLPAPDADGELERFRDVLRRAVAEEDITAQIMVLEPLLAEVSALELAAAASALLRRTPPKAEPEAAPELAAEPSQPPAYVRLFISVGNRDNLRPGDLVGAITGEADVPGAAIGRIEIRDTFSIVEVAHDHAERVLKALNGITLKGRSVRADYDRKGSPPAREATRARRGPLGERMADRRGPRRPS